MTHTRTRSTYSSLALVIALVTSLLALTPTMADAQVGPKTDFGFRGSGFATLVTTGVVDGVSGRTGQSSLPCTSRTGVQRSNSVAGVDVDALIDVGAASTTNESVQMPNGSLHSVTTSEIARVFVGTADTGIEIEGITMVARAWWDGSEFQKRKWMDVASVNLVIAGIPTPLSVDEFLDAGVVLPGIAEIRTGVQSQFEDANSAWIKGTSLQVELLGDTAIVNIGRAWAMIEGVESDPFAGQAFGLRADAVGSLARVGPIARQPLPCAGTDGEWLQTPVVDVNAGIVDATGVSSQIFGNPWPDYEFEVARGEADIANVSLLSGTIQVEGLHTQAHLRKKANGTYMRSADGTTFVSLEVDGSTYTTDDFVNGVLEVPGVARLELAKFEGKAQGVKHGMIVTGLDITLLDGTGANIELAKVRLVIK